MDDKDSEYRRQAADAQSQADQTISDTDKAAWLRIAQGWLALIRRPKQTEQDSFEANAKTRSTGQDDSKGSH